MGERQKLAALVPVVLAFLVAGTARAQEHGESHEEDFHRNEIALALVSTYEATEESNFFTVGVEYARFFTERFGVVGEFEVLPDLNAWVFVAPFVFKIAGEFEVFAGPGFEHLARRSGREEGEGAGAEHHEGFNQHENVAESGADNLFLFRFGAGYHLRLGERFFMVPHVALDLIDEQDEVARAVIYGVTVGFGF